MGRRRIVSHEPVWTCDCEQDRLLPCLGAGTVRGSSHPADDESRVGIGLQLLLRWMVMEMYALAYKLIKLRTGVILWKFIAHGRVRVVREERDRTLPWLHEEEEGVRFFFTAFMIFNIFFTVNLI